jgi:hypothetical protein
VIVFVIGGGNYVEYQNVQEWAKSVGLQRMTYGCTEMVSPKHFVEQVGILEWKVEYGKSFFSVDPIGTEAERSIIGYEMNIWILWNFFCDRFFHIWSFK